KLEAQLRQAQKMEAIGILAGGIAHDFNNILGGITGYTELALMDMAPRDKSREYLNQVLKAGDRARELVKQILAFSRQVEPELRPIKIGPTVNEALKLLRASLPTTIEIKRRLDPDIGSVMADPTQVHQVLMNLCTNAAHAMRPKGGVLEVSTNEVDIDAGTAARHHDLRPGRYARLTVCDNGQGMSKEVLERIFDPFFTTKERGQGTGMGLAVAHGIIKSHGGTIKAYSEAGKGSSFQVFLPVTPLEPGETPRAGKPIPMGLESILFVDDEKVLVDVGQLVLERLGYRVDGRTSSLEALKAFQTHPEKYDLVITDQTMPQMTGMELAEKLLLIRPDIPIILCTGFSESINPDLARDMNIQRFLMKPLIASELGTAIRKALGQAR
ncbi:MAG: ATP-binding protein, partial [Thermodesulfobacteriota bacterium]|nr:ATP-binding protein [Thermodesulfobacteriota bacterium]